MKLNIQKQALRTALNTVTSVIDKNPTLPTLSNVLFSIEDGTLTLTASDGDVSIKTSTQDILESVDGSLLVDGKTIADAVSKLNNDILIENKDNRIKVESSTTEYKLNSAEVSSYPKIDFTIKGEEIKIDGNEFIHTLNKVINSVSTGMDRPIFMGVNIVAQSGTLVMSATDSYRLSRTSLNTDNNQEFNVTILANTLKTIMKIAKDKELFVSTDNTRVTFRTDDTIITTRIIDGLYPELDRLIPQDFNVHITTDRQKLINAVDRASFMKEDNVWILKLTTKDDILSLETKTTEIGTTYDEVASTNQGDIEISLNGRYLLNALQALEDDEVTFNIVGDMQALTVSDSTNQVQLLLPVRTF